jgi:phosphoglycerate dehydrogenase-like enzyme
VVLPAGVDADEGVGRELAVGDVGRLHRLVDGAHRKMEREQKSARIGAAAADISRHRGVDVGIVGLGVAASSAAADMIWPDWQ